MQIIEMKDYSQKELKYNLSTSPNRPIKFGDDNLFPKHLWEAINNSPIQSAILKARLQYAIGDDMTLTSSVKAPNFTTTWYDLYKRVLSDYIYFGAFAIQAIVNKDGKTLSYYHQPVEQVRLGNYDENNQITKAFLNVDWSRSQSYKTIDMWNGAIHTLESGKAYLIYISDNQPFQLFYGLPTYFSLLNWIKVDGALAAYNLNFIKNNMSTNKVITYPMVPSEEDIEIIKKNLAELQSGTANAGGTLLLFGENGIAPVIQDMATADSDLYQNLVDTTFKYLISGNRLPSPTLAGLSPTSGFSSTAEELLTAYKLYLQTVITKDREFVVKSLNKLIKYNYPTTTNQINITDNKII